MMAFVCLQVLVGAAVVCSTGCEASERNSSRASQSASHAETRIDVFGDTITIAASSRAWSEQGGDNGNSTKSRAVALACMKVRRAAQKVLSRSASIAMDPNALQECAESKMLAAGVDTTVMSAAKARERVAIVAVIAYREGKRSLTGAAEDCYQRSLSLQRPEEGDRLQKWVQREGSVAAWFETVAQAWPTAEFARQQLHRLDAVTPEVYLFGQACEELLVWQQLLLTKSGAQAARGPSEEEIKARVRADTHPGAATSRVEARWELQAEITYSEVYLFLAEAIDASSIVFTDANLGKAVRDAFRSGWRDVP